MKTNKGILIGLAAAALVGAATFLLVTQKGKRITANLKKKGRKLAEEVTELIDDTSKKFSDLRKEFLECESKKESVVEETQ